MTVAELLTSPRAAAAAAAAAAASSANNSAAAASTTTSTAGPLVLLGSYTDYEVLPHWPHGTPSGAGGGITVARWGEDKAALSVLHTVPCLNPAFMKLHPTLNVVYVLSETIATEGYLTAFRLDAASGALSELGRLSMTGRSSCYISFDRAARHAVVTNYWDGVIDVVELGANGAPLRIVQSHQQTRRAAWRQVVNREDHMANRQDGPHAHCNVFHPSYRWVFVPDLGDNAIHQYGFDASASGNKRLLTHQAAIELPPGEGPRHFVFHPRLPVAYSGCELLSRVQVFAVDDSEPDAVRPRIRAVQSHPTLPEGFSATNYVGEIKIDAAGRFVYVSNRGHHSIAVFRVDQATGRLAPVAVEPTLGATPRHFGLSPCGRFAVVGDQDDDVVKVFGVCQDTGRLSFVPGAAYPLRSPNFVLFVKPHPAPPRAVGASAVLLDSAGAAAVATAAAAAAAAATSSAAAPSREELEMVMSPTAVVACS